VSPWAPKRPCARTGCPRLVSNAAPCPEHGRRPWEHGRPSSAERGYGATWKRLRRLILARDPLCVLCLAAGHGSPSTTVDHIVPRSQGGTDEESNLRGLCRAHHETKSAREGQAAGR
jgi:5-methylcytosine-specific restriction enzyme A